MKHQPLDRECLLSTLALHRVPKKVCILCGRFATYGTTVIIKSADFSPGGPVQLDTEGGRRFKVMVKTGLLLALILPILVCLKVLSHSMRDGYHFAHVKFFSDVKEDGEQLEGKE